MFGTRLPKDQKCYLYRDLEMEMKISMNTCSEGGDNYFWHGDCTVNPL